MKAKKLSIVVPIFNEKKTIRTILKKLEAVPLPVQKEIILVDDFSTDGTRDILKNLEKSYNIIYHTKNQGKGAALRTGFAHASGDIITIQDADLEYDPAEYAMLIQPILQGKAKVVYGSRFLGQKLISRQRWAIPSHYLGNKLLSLITSVLYFHWVTDMETCYKMFTREVLESLKLRARRFDFEPEITAKIIKRGYDILEIPITYKPRGFHKGKKITWKDGIKALGYLVRYRVMD